MSRIFVILSLILSSCVVVDESAFTHLSTLETRSRGVQLNYSGDSAQVGMIGNTCEIHTNTGIIGTDFDLVIGEEDVVQDSDGPFTLVLGSAGSGVVILNNEDWLAGGNQVLTVDSVHAAKFVESGVVILKEEQNGCKLEWYESGPIISNSDVPCDFSDIAVDTESGNVYLATSDGLKIGWKNNPPIEHPFTGDLVSFNSTVGNFYSADTGSSIVSGSNYDTTWETDVGMPITSMDDMGDSGEIVLMTGDENEGAIVVLDGSTGDIEYKFPTPSSADDITSSGDGNILAVTVGDQIHFYRVSR